MSDRLIRLRLSPWMVQLISTALEHFQAEADAFLTFSENALPADQDEELHSIWLQSLREQLQSDFGVLRKTLVRLRANGIADLDTQEAEAFLRTANAVRLNLQRDTLRMLSIEDLQSDTLCTDHLPASAQVAYACYTLLAEIQGQIIAQIELRENAPSMPPEAYPSDFSSNGTDDNSQHADDNSRDTDDDSRDIDR